MSDGFEIEVVNGAERGRRAGLGPEGLVLGRGEEATFRIADASASRRHARIFWDGAALVVEDLKSGNGTLVNNARIARMTLRGGEEILVGDTLVRVHAPARPGPADGTVVGGARPAAAFSPVPAAASSPAAAPAPGAEPAPAGSPAKRGPLKNPVILALLILVVAGLGGVLVMQGGEEGEKKGATGPTAAAAPGSTDADRFPPPKISVEGKSAEDIQKMAEKFFKDADDHLRNKEVNRGNTYNAIAELLKARELFTILKEKFGKEPAVKPEEIEAKLADAKKHITDQYRGMKNGYDLCCDPKVPSNESPRVLPGKEKDAKAILQKIRDLIPVNSIEGARDNRAEWAQKELQRLETQK